MELNENLRTPLSRSCDVEVSLASFFVVFSAIGDYSCRRPYPVSPSRFPESITRRSCNIFVTGDIVATDTNKAQTDGWTDGRTDRRMDRQGRCCIFRLLTTAENVALRRHELAKASTQVITLEDYYISLSLSLVRGKSRVFYFKESFRLI